MNVLVAAAVAICCGPGVGNCGCPVAMTADSPAFVLSAAGDGVVMLAGTDIKITYRVITDDYAVDFHGTIRSAQTLDDAEAVALSIARKLIVMGIKP